MLTGPDIGNPSGWCFPWTIAPPRLILDAESKSSKVIDTGVVLSCLGVWTLCRSGLGLAEGADSGRAAFWQQAALAWLSLELAWFVLQKFRFASCNPPVTSAPADVKVVKQRFLELRDVLCIREFISGWFHGAPFESICRGNVHDFVSYGWCCKPIDELTPQEDEDVEDFLEAVEEQWGHKFPPGRNPDVRFMAHLWEPLRTVHKPLVLHLGSEAWGLVVRGILAAMGFTHGKEQGMSYWVRLPAKTDRFRPQQPALDGRGDSAHGFDGMASSEVARQRPVVFLHGVGLGLLPYLHFLHLLAGLTPSHPLVLFEFRNVQAASVWGRARSVDETAGHIAAVLRRHGFSEACFCAHSFGTFVASRLCQLHRPLVQSLALLDPVCLMTCSPELLHNFVYKQPSWRNLTSLLGLMDCIRFIISRDVVVAEQFCRLFVWHQLQLFPSDMPRQTLIMLSRHDDLVPGHLVEKQLKSSKSTAKLLVHPTAAHGSVFCDAAWLPRIAREVARLAGTPQESAAC